MKEYLVIYQRAGENWCASVPDLPVCVAAADTLEETKKLIREAIQFHIEGLKEDGDPIPEPVTTADLVGVAA